MTYEEHEMKNQMHLSVESEKRARALGFNLILGAVAIIAGAATGVAITKPSNPCLMPLNPTVIERNYAQSSKLEVLTKDVDGSSVKETVLDYNGRQYLLKLGADEKLYLVESNIRK